MTTLRTALSRLRERALGVAPRHPNPYATHLPVLLAAGQILRPKAVLELGSGPFSTSLFLDRSAFPDLESLVSYEDDAKWAEVVQGKVGGDERLDYRVVDRVPSAVPEDLSGFDLIFIDDSVAVPDRAETIRRVLSLKPPGAVAIHDFENRHYRAAARGASSRVVMDTFTPQTGILLVNDAQGAQLKRAVSVIGEGASRGLDLEDVSAWLDLIGQHAM